MMDFKALDAHAVRLLDAYVRQNDRLGSDYSYYAYLIWFDEVEYAESGGALYLRAEFGGKLRYWEPLSESGGSVRDAIFRLPYASELFACTKRTADEMIDLYDARSDRGRSEYIYLTQDFISLKGKRYNAKRNHIHKFLSEYTATMAPYERRDLDELRAFEEKWFASHRFDSEDAAESAEREREIMFAAIDASLRGETRCDVLRIDGNIAGFSVGERIGENCAVIIYEKADIGYDGIYSYLANSFAARNFADCKYINRQEDMGIEGLRRSKLSYCPEFLLDKYDLTPISRPSLSASGERINDKFGVLNLNNTHFNLVMSFLKEGIASLDDKLFFLNYTDSQLMEALDGGRMMAAIDGDKIIATCGVDLDSDYGNKLKAICKDDRDRNYYEFSGVMTKREYRRMGISSALCKRAIDAVRGELGGSTLCAVVQKGNEPSLRNLEKLGFVPRAEAESAPYDFIYLTLDI